MAPLRRRDRGPGAAKDAAAISVLRDDVAMLAAAVARMETQLQTTEAVLVRVAHVLDALSGTWDEASLLTRLDRMSRVLGAIRANEATNRERLFAIRKTTAYGAAYAEPDPLVSVIVPTFDRVDLLLERSLPSLLGQSYANVEVIVVGDGSPGRVGDAIDDLADPRVRYVHLGINGPYPEDQIEAWHIKGSPGINAGLFEARGRWVSFFADDDALRPTAIATVLASAREHRYELCYGRTSCTWSDGRVTELGAFPPVVGHFQLQGALMNAELRFLQHELSDAEMLIPNDWSLVNRLHRLGGRIGFVDAVVADYFETPPPSGG
jgi:hypothetical protein